MATTWTKRPGLTADIYNLQVRNNAGTLVDLYDNQGRQVKVHAEPDYPLDTQWDVRTPI